VSDVRSLRLPKDVTQWRVLHVQAWVAITMELPLYMDNFQQGSINGLVLLHHVTEDVLVNILGIADDLHLKKIMGGIRDLQKQNEKFQKELEAKRLAELKRQEEADAKLKHDEEMRRKEANRAATSERKKRKKKKKKIQVTGTTAFGDVVESNGIERVKIEREMKKYRESQRRQEETVKKSNEFWKFEYTGTPKPAVESIWDNPSSIGGSSEYQRAVAVDILSSQEFIGLNNELERPKELLNVRVVPSNASPDEVIAVTKRAMFEVSNWLLKLETMKINKQAMLDSDIDNYLQELDDIQEKYVDNEAVASPPYPFLDEKDVDYPDNTAGTVEEDDDVSSIPPPAYSLNDDVVVVNENDDEVAIPPPYSLTHSSPVLQPETISKLPRIKTVQFSQRTKKVPNRMELLFYSFVQRKNNDAAWLGSNSKLTRLKLQGGLESVLRLKLTWSQFDALWTRLDYKRSGDVDFKEFNDFFNDLNDFEILEGTQTLSSVSGSKSMQTLTKLLYELCDALRHAGLTVVEIFKGFDRNGSGEISIAEFCSLLKLITGSKVEKKYIYQALLTVDVDGSKSVSLEEMMVFVYRIWKQQLSDLARKLEPVVVLDADRLKNENVMQERDKIKEAIRLNFPRAWRDKFERAGYDHLQGPFVSLFNRMMAPPGDNKDGNLLSTTGSLPATSTSPTRVKQSPNKARPLSSTGVSKTSKVSYENETMRYKVKAPGTATQPSSRGPNTLLTLPPPIRMNDFLQISGEATTAILRKSEEIQFFK